MTGVWWVDVGLMVIFIIIVVYIKPCDDRPSTLERAEVDELERMWKL